jgi:hypothetical protein
MKRINLFSIGLILLMFFAAAAIAQTDVTVNTYNGKALLVTFPSTKIDSTATVYSDWFSIAGYDAESFATYPMHWGRLLTSVKGKPRILWVVEGSYDGGTTAFTIDTLSVNADSTETYGVGTMNFNSKKAPLIRYKITGTAGNRSDTYAKGEAYIPRKRVE